MPNNRALAYLSSVVSEMTLFSGWGPDAQSVPPWLEVSVGDPPQYAFYQVSGLSGTHLSSSELRELFVADQCAPDTPPFEHSFITGSGHPSLQNLPFYAEKVDLTCCFEAPLTTGAHYRPTCATFCLLASDEAGPAAIAKFTLTLEDSDCGEPEDYDDKDEYLDDLLNVRLTLQLEKTYTLKTKRGRGAFRALTLAMREALVTALEHIAQQLQPATKIAGRAFTVTPVLAGEFSSQAGYLAYAMLTDEIDYITDVMYAAPELFNSALAELEVGDVCCESFASKAS